MKQTQILIIDDEPPIRRALRVGLEHNGYDVILAATGTEGLDMVASHRPDLIILDIGLPDMEGLDTCRQLREWGKAPIIILSVREDQHFKIAALDSGADDYLTKPFSSEELLARIRAIMRRANAIGTDGPVVTTGGLHMDFARRHVTVDNTTIHLTPTEYELLRYMALHPDRVVTHRQLLTKVWGEQYAEDVHTLRVHMANLRNKIESNPARPHHLQTEHRIGYRFRIELAS